MWWQELDILYIYIERERDHPIDNRYGFSISVQPEMAVLFTVSFQNVRKMVFKIFKSWQLGLWFVGEVVNHVGIYGSRVAEGWSAFQRRILFQDSVTQGTIANISEASHRDAWLFFPNGCEIAQQHLCFFGTSNPMNKWGHICETTAKFKCKIFAASFIYFVTQIVANNA